MSRLVRLKSELRRVRLCEPEAYKLALIARQSIQPDTFKQAQNVGVAHFGCTIMYERQTAFSANLLGTDSCMLIISTNEFWELQRTTPFDTPTAIPNSSERVWTTNDIPDLLLVWEDGNETVRQIAAPLSDALGFEGAINRAVDAVCSTCGERSSWHTSVFCHLCQATVWCSERCKERDTAHGPECAEETECAERILGYSQAKPYYPFVLGLGGFPYDAIPIECAIELPLIPSMLLGGLTPRDGRTLVQNNILVRRLYEVDLEEQIRRAEASAAANAAQLIEEEESVRDRRERRRLKRKGRKKVAVFESVAPMAPPSAATTSDDENRISSGTVAIPTPPSTDDSVIVALEHDEPSAELICPITQSIMSDPVVIASGHTYERQAIEAWFSRSSTNPLTGATVPHTHLIPNITVRALCREYNQLNL